MDKEVLSKSLDEFWESISILRTEGMPPSSLKNEHQLVQGRRLIMRFTGLRGPSRRRKSRH